MPDIDATLTAGVEAGGYRIGATSADSWYQKVVTVPDRIVSYEGRATTFQSAGRAAGSLKLLSIVNAAGSTVIVAVNQVRVDLSQTAVKAITLIPPIVKLQRFTVTPTAGTALAKVPLDTNFTSNSSVTLLQDQSADAPLTASAATGTALAISAFTGCLTQTFSSKVITGAGYEVVDPMLFLQGETDVLLRAGEGLCVEIFTQTAGNSPATDKWIATIDWEEYTRP